MACKDATGHQELLGAFLGRERTALGRGPGAGAAEVGPAAVTMVVLAAVGDVLRTELRPLRRPPNRPGGGDVAEGAVVVADAVLVAVG